MMECLWTFTNHLLLKRKDRKSSICKEAKHANKIMLFLFKVKIDPFDQKVNFQCRKELLNFLKR